MNCILGISVIICTWNRCSLLKNTLQSLNQQAGCEGIPIEIIIVDNNSTDDTKSIIETISINWKLGAIRYAFEPQQGKQFALNRGIQLSRYEILAFTDDDVIFINDWLSTISLLFKNPQLDLVGGKTIAIWPNSEKPRWYHQSMSAVVAEVDLGDYRLNPTPVGYAPAGTNLVARRSLFDKVGGFSESHFRHMDYDFGLRCTRLGAHVEYDPSLIIYAPVDFACLNKRYFRRWYFKAGIDITENQHIPLLLVPTWIYRRIIEDLIFMFFHLFMLDDPYVFSRELRMWRYLGLFSSRWNAKFNPKRFSKWQERKSQKKRNLY